MLEGFFEITLIILTTLAVVSTVWYTLKTGIPPMPSSRKARQAMLIATESSGEGDVMDMGSGWGTLVIAFAKKYPERQITGYEISFIPWLVSMIRKYIGRIDNLSLCRQDFLKADLSKTSVLLCYLLPEGMCVLKNMLDLEPNRVSLIVSNTFALPSGQAVKVVRLDDIYRTPIYVYQRSPSTNSH